MVYKVEALKQIKLTVEQFERLRDNPIQRDTERHATQANRPPYGHLSKPHPSHAHVSVGLLPSGKYVKLDGHCRSFLWSLGALEEPSILYATVYPIENMKQAQEYYLTFDSSLATETPLQQMHGAMRMAKFTPSTTIFENSGTLSAMKVLAFPRKWSDVKRLSVAHLIAPHIETFRIIDRAGDIIRNHYHFPRWVMCAFIMSVTADGAAALPFWEGYQLKEGTKQKNKADGIYMACARFDAIKADRLRQIGTSGVITREAPYMLACYDNWKHGTMMTIPKVGRGRKKEEELTPLSEWWHQNIGDYYYPELHEKQTEELSEA